MRIKVLDFLSSFLYALLMLASTSYATRKGLTEPASKLRDRLLPLHRSCPAEPLRWPVTPFRRRISNEKCATQPERVAQQLVDYGMTNRYDFALQTLTELPYASWREFDPEDSVRFFALRLHELGMIKSSPKTIVENGTDWRFLNELKRELKA